MHCCRKSLYLINKHFDQFVTATTTTTFTTSIDFKGGSNAHAQCRRNLDKSNPAQSVDSREGCIAARRVTSYTS